MRNVFVAADHVQENTGNGTTRQLNFTRVWAGQGCKKYGFPPYTMLASAAAQEPLQQDLELSSPKLNH